MARQELPPEKASSTCPDCGTEMVITRVTPVLFGGAFRISPSCARSAVLRKSSGSSEVDDPSPLALAAYPHPLLVGLGFSPIRRNHTKEPGARRHQVLLPTRGAMGIAPHIPSLLASSTRTAQKGSVPATVYDQSISGAGKLFGVMPYRPLHLFRHFDNRRPLSRVHLNLAKVCYCPFATWCTFCFLSHDIPAAGAAAR